jgi:hypothetical protein
MDDRDDDIEAGIRAVHSEAAGVLRLVLVAPDDLTDLIVAALVLHDTSALSRLRLVDRFMRRIEGQDDAAAFLCLTCDRRLTAAADCGLIAIVTPERDDASACLVIGICEACCAAHRDHAAAGEAVVAALRRGIWPDLRPILSPAAQAGRG